MADRVVNNIRWIRRLIGITQEELANHVGISREQLSRIERGLHHPCIYYVLLMSEYFSYRYNAYVPIESIFRVEHLDEEQTIQN